MAMTKAKDALCIKYALLTGCTAAQDITVTGAKAEDTVLMCLGISTNATAAPVDYTAYASFTDDNDFQSSTGTADMSLAVLWLDNSA